MNRTIIIILLLAATAIAGIFLVKPKYEEYVQKKAELERKQTELDYHQQHFSALKEVEERFRQSEENFKKIDDTLPSFFSLPAFYANMLKLASQSGMVVDQMAHSGTANPQERMKKQSFSLSLSGTFASFNNFLNVIEKSARIFEVDGMNLKFPEEEGETMSFSLNIHTFSY